MFGLRFNPVNARLRHNATGLLCSFERQPFAEGSRGGLSSVHCRKACSHICIRRAFAAAECKKGFPLWGPGFGLLFPVIDFQADFNCYIL